LAINYPTIAPPIPRRVLKRQPSPGSSPGITKRPRTPATNPAAIVTSQPMEEILARKQVSCPE